VSLGWPILLVFFLFLFWKRTFGNNSGFCRPTNKTLKGMQSLASNRKYHPLALYRGRICQNYEKSCTSMWQVCEILHDDRYGHKVFKNIARKLRLPSKSLLARNSIWLPPIKLNSVLQLLCALESCVILLFQCCYFFLGGGVRIPFLSFFLFQGHFQGQRPKFKENMDKNTHKMHLHRYRQMMLGSRPMCGSSCTLCCACILRITIKC